VLAGCVLGVLAAVAGGPLGDGRLAAVGPSGWQVGAVAALEVGVAAAVTAGVANWWRLRAGPRPGTARRTAPAPLADATLPGRDQGGADDGHTIYLDPWAGAADQPSAKASRGPSSLP
jgi:hypothetical protein